MSIASKGLPLLAGLSAPALLELDRHDRDSIVPGGHLILREGEPGRHLFVIEKGSVRVFKARQGCEIELARLGSGEFFGELSVLDPEDRSANVVASETTSLIIFPRVAWEILADQYLPDYARFLENLARELARRLRLADDRIASAS